MGLFFGRRETLNEQLAREAGLSPEPQRRRPGRGLLILMLRRIRARRAAGEQRTLVKYTSERGYLNEQEAALGREKFRLRAPDTPPPGFG